MSKLHRVLLLLLVTLPFVSCTRSDFSAGSDEANKSKPVAKVSLSQAQVKELKDIGARVARRDPFDKIESDWKSFVEKAKDIDIGSAVDVITREAEQEAAENLEPSTKRLQELNTLKGAVNDELSRARGLLAASKERRQNVMINKKEFEVGGEPPGVTVKPGQVIASQPEVAGYVKELETRVRSIDNDTRAVSMELGNMTQRRQAVMKNLPETAKKLREIGRRVKQGTLW
jgi:hypothetical protein